MSLLQLLTTGKSLVGIKDTQPRYRVTHERLLPRFGPAKNPFCATDNLERLRTEPGESLDRALATSPRRVAAASPVSVEEPSGGLSAAVTVKVPAQMASPQPGGAKTKLPFWGMASRTKWAGRLRSLFSRADRKAAKAALPRLAKPQVQGELALDKIKVVRNDLSDADLEIVPARQPSARGGADPGLPSAERTEVSGMARGRFAGLFGAGSP